MSPQRETTAQTQAVLIITKKVLILNFVVFLRPCIIIFWSNCHLTFLLTEIKCSIADVVLFSYIKPFPKKAFYFQTEENKQLRGFLIFSVTVYPQLSKTVLKLFHTVKLLLTFFVLDSATLASDRSTSSNIRDCEGKRT